MRYFSGFALLVWVLLSTGAVLAQEEEPAEWGDLKGTFIYDGEIPEPKLLPVRRVAAAVPNESLLVGEMGGVRNVVVHLYRVGGVEPPVHPSYAESADARVNLACKNFRFEPHVVLLRTSQTLVVGNQDAVGHNAKFNCMDNPPINIVLATKGSLPFEFRRRERMPIRLDDAIHPWMSGYLVVQDHPYMATSDDKGSFTIRNLPAGEWTFQFWHEQAGALAHVKHNDEEKELPNGRLRLTIEPGENDLGTIRLAPSIFGRDALR